MQYGQSLFRLRSLSQFHRRIQHKKVLHIEAVCPCTAGKIYKAFLRLIHLSRRHSPAYHLCLLLKSLLLFGSVINITELISTCAKPGQKRLQHRAGRHLRPVLDPGYGNRRTDTVSQFLLRQARLFPERTNDLT